VSDQLAGSGPENSEEREFETGEQRRRQYVVSFSPQLTRAREDARLAPINSDGVYFRIDHPVFRDRHTFVELTLDRLIPLPCALRGNLNDQFGRAANVFRREHFLGAGIGHVQQIGLDDVEVREDDVERREEDAANWMLLQPGRDQEVQIAE